MSTRQTLILSRSEVQNLLSMEECIRVQEEAYRISDSDRVTSPTRVWLMMPQYRAFLILGGSYVGGDEIIAVKLVSAAHNNPSEHGLPDIIGLIVLYEAKTCFPLAIMDGTYITAVRTGAGGAIAAKYLARKNIESVSVLGSGRLAREHLIALVHVFPKVREARIYSRNLENAKKYRNELSQEVGIQIVLTNSPSEAVNNTDMVICATSAQEAVLVDADITSGVFISAIGSGSECDPKILKRAKLVVDNLPECKAHGKLAAGVKAKTTSETAVYGTISEIVAGKKSGRTNPEEIILYDSVGLPVQDALTAITVYNNAISKGRGTYTNLLS